MSFGYLLQNSLPADEPANTNPIAVNRRAQRVYAVPSMHSLFYLPDKVKSLLPLSDWTSGVGATTCQ